MNGTQIKRCRRRRSRRKTEPHLQTSSQCPAGESLRRMDRPAKNNPVVRTLGRQACSFQAEIEARVGGLYRVSFSTDDEYYEVGGVYREVVPNEKLVFSWAWHSTPERESLVTVALNPDGDGTLLTLHHEQLFDQAARDGHERGWLGSLDKLEKLIA